MALHNLDIEADLKARLVVIASMLYYGLDVTFMPDTLYDKMSSFVSDNWHRLSPLRQWQVGSREEVRTSGFQCKVTHLAADSAVEWMIKNRIPMQSPLPIIITRRWRSDKRQGLQYLHTNEFSWR